MIKSSIVILSACESGVYTIHWGDNPEGAAPNLIEKGVKICIGARYPIGAEFALIYFQELSRLLAQGMQIREAFIGALKNISEKADLWKDIACLEMIGVV